MIPWWWLLVAASVFVALVSGVHLKSAKASGRRQCQVDAMREELDGMLLQVKDYQQRAEKAERLAQVHLEANANFEKQRNDAWARYHAAGLGAGNAQAMLLGSLEGAVRELNRYRQEAGLEPVEVNQGLRDIVADFKREHVK